MADFKSKVRDIGELLAEMDENEKRVILKFIIMNDLKLYTEVLFEEQKRLEKECGIKGVTEYEEFDNPQKNTVQMDHKDGFLGYVDGEGGLKS